MVEANKRKCKMCGEIKNRIQDDKFPNGINKKWLDENGKQWMGNSCPPCNSDRVNFRAKAKRFNVK